eukprot:TRINITY_DN121109_c0_g1_i1.p1 TRINITY_DN121109_c0_g1~~TRINITY_DN121109_c0_g1_i1.p1  ORF type:complete len:528 (+),score=100.95 TRINITY_DN121109_c0_g1_i1:77-1660(+)
MASPSILAFAGDAALRGNNAFIQEPTASAACATAAAAQGAAMLFMGGAERVQSTTSAPGQLLEAIRILQDLHGSMTQDDALRQRPCSDGVEGISCQKAEEGALKRELEELRASNYTLQQELGMMKCELEAHKPEGLRNQGGYISYLNGEVQRLVAELAVAKGERHEPRPQPVFWDSQQRRLSTSCPHSSPAKPRKSADDALLSPGSPAKRPRLSLGAGPRPCRDIAVLPAVPTLEGGWWHPGGPTHHDDQPLLEEDTPIPSAQPEVVPADEEAEEHRAHLRKGLAEPPPLFDTGELAALVAEDEDHHQRRGQGKSASSAREPPERKAAEVMQQEAPPDARQALITNCVPGLKVFNMPRPEQAVEELDDVPCLDADVPLLLLPPWRAAEAARLGIAAATNLAGQRCVRAEGRAAIAALAAAAESRGGPMAREVVRKQSDRRLLAAFDCDECRRFYEATGQKPTGCDVHQGGFHAWKGRQGASRHRYAHAPVNTPPGFWDLSFPVRDSVRADDDHKPAAANDAEDLTHV